jgi:hypothetical protein
MSQTFACAQEGRLMIGGVVGVELNGQVLSAHIGGISNALEQPATNWPSTHWQTQFASARVENVETTPIAANPTRNLSMQTSSWKIYQ